MDRVRRIYELKGVVQGVGLRPTLYRLASEDSIGGWVQNRTGAVLLCLEASERVIDGFMSDLGSRLPGNAVIDSLRLVEQSTVEDGKGITEFEILESSSSDQLDVTIPVDLRICSKCLKEIFDASDRRYGYPFTTCTDCGPRYTVVNSMPYDRERTTLCEFPMCSACAEEYSDPLSRRFHAESIACPACGPKLTLETVGGVGVQDPVVSTRKYIAEGAIVAVRGIGGYLLACDAFNNETLSELRKRKHRPSKPFAVMARDISVIKEYCVMDKVSEEMLVSPRAPIVVLDTRPDMRDRLPMHLLSPDSGTLGVMLPTSPLHALLFQPLDGDDTPAFDVLVMTSGNRGGEPICISNEEAADRLDGIADYILRHNREINLRNDDSLSVSQNGLAQVWRRARGYAPEPLALSAPVARNVLAMGGELKNTVSFAAGNKVFISPHVGDLESPEAVKGMEQVAECLPGFLEKEPECVAVDLHPDMHSTRYGRSLAEKSGLPVVDVQHHHAHAAACLEENGFSEGLALVMDGTGLGVDDSIWGAELLEIANNNFKRLASFRGVALPGGDAAVRYPARQLAGRWLDAGVEPSAEIIERIGITEWDLSVWQEQCRKSFNAPITHAAGRLFDSVSVLLGAAPATVTYEGQAAIALEGLAGDADGHFPCGLDFLTELTDDMLWVDFSPVITKLSEMDVVKGREASWALAFHDVVAKAAVKMAEYGASRTGRRDIALTGGVFMNRILNRILVPMLEKSGMNVLRHRLTPPNDGCISFGQAVIAGRV